MADTNKTMKPTSRRLQKAREGGDIPYSAEVVSAVSLISLAAAVVLMGPWVTTHIKQELIEGLQCRAELADNSQVFIAYINKKILLMMTLTAPFLATLSVFGVAACIWVSGWNFRMSALKLKFDELMPHASIKKFFSVESIIKLLTGVAKLTLIGSIVFFYVRKKIPLLATLQWVQPDQILAAIGSLLIGVIFRICLGLIVIAAVDYAYRRWKYFDHLMMTKQEVKEEHRDTEGPPELKRKLRTKQFELGMRRMLKKVPKASVVVVNPTHVAVALEYQPGYAAPVVVAKGADHLCEKIKEIARAYGVPIIRRPELARELYATVKLDQPIPDKLYTAVAEVLAVIFRLKRSHAAR